MKPFKILIVEDEYLFASEIKEDIVEEFPGIHAEFTLITTESEFDKMFRTAEPPGDFDVVILDLMIRWADPESTEKKSKEAEMNGYYAAGIRCYKQLRKLDATRSVPVIIHSNLTHETTMDKLESEKVDMKNLQVIPKSETKKPLLNGLKALMGSKEQVRKED